MNIEHKQGILDKVCPGRFIIEGVVPDSVPVVYVVMDNGIRRNLTWKQLRRSASHTDLLSKYRSKVDPLRYEILSLVPSKGRQRILVRDIVRDRTFEISWHSFSSRVKADPNTIFDATPAERQLRILDSNISKYGVSSTSKLDSTRDKISNSITRHTIEGRNLREIADEFSLSYTYVVQLHRRLGHTLLQWLSDNPINSDGSSIEAIFRSEILESLGVGFVQQPDISGLRPDFFVPSHNLIVECDGLYWHSEARGHTRMRHFDRRVKFESIGYKFLSFREDELLNPHLIPIIRSMVSNSVGMSTKVHARKTKIVDVGQSFLHKNHMMGCGSKKTGYGLEFDGDIVMAMTFKRSPKSGWEIDRMCTLSNHIVVGGVSKLLSHFVNMQSPSNISTFVDRRYGTGCGLLKLGFILKHEYPSFRWTNFRDTCHRLKFRGTPTAGWTKIWDYGQAKFVLDLS